MTNDLRSRLEHCIGTFEATLVARGYTVGTIRTYRVLLRRLASRMETAGIEPADLKAERAAELVRDAEHWRREPNKCRNMARRFTAHLIDIGVAAAAVPSAQQIARRRLKEDYERYLTRQRGLSPRTIFHGWRFADRFLDHRFGTGAVDVAQIRPGDVVAFLQHYTGRTGPYGDRSGASHLRSFLRYLFSCGATPTNLAACVPIVARRWGRRLPRYLAPHQIEALLAAVRDNPKHGRRDYAMLLVMARLGLRAPEVIAIQLDDLDWRAGELLVRGKGGRHDRLPIPHDVGEALAGYIRHERASASRTLFVSLRAPHAPFRDSQVINAILKEAFAATGVTPPCPYVGSHVLRHSLATNMVRHGASLVEIGDVLRHRSRASTMIYAKLDLDGLRTIARSWPTVGGAR